jgi:hypothetical protein
MNMSGSEWSAAAPKKPTLSSVYIRQNIFSQPPRQFHISCFHFDLFRHGARLKMFCLMTRAGACRRAYPIASHAYSVYAQGQTVVGCDRRVKMVMLQRPNAHATTSGSSSRQNASPCDPTRSVITTSPPALRSGARNTTVTCEVVARITGVGRRESMNGNHAPRVATWLLRHFGSSRNIEAIVGGLDERYGQAARVCGIGGKSVSHWSLERKQKR